MAQTGFSVIKPYYSTTPGAVPAVANFAIGEIAANLADKRLFGRDGGGLIFEYGTNPSSVTTTSITTTTLNGFQTSQSGGPNRILVTDSLGNLGIGVTARTSTGVVQALELGQTGYFSGGVSGESAAVQSNSYLAAGAIQTYSTTGFATAYVQSGGLHQWLTAPSGIAGNPITFTQVMTLTLSGRLETIGPMKPGTYTVAALPAMPPDGSMAYASNGRKVGEGVGAGTGVPVYYSGGAWRVFSTDAAVQS